MTHVLTEHPYFGVFVLFALTAVAFPATLWLARFVSRKLARLDTEKLKLTILLFILFDVEIIFMFPWAIDFKLLGWFGFAEMILFILLLAIGFVYAWKKGALEWHSIK